MQGRIQDIVMGGWIRIIFIAHQSEYSMIHRKTSMYNVCTLFRYRPCVRLIIGYCSHHWRSTGYCDSYWCSVLSGTFHCGEGLPWRHENQKTRQESVRDFLQLTHLTLTLTQSLPLSLSPSFSESPHYSDRGGAIPTTSNMAYELTTLPGPDDGSHEYEVIGRDKAVGPQSETEGAYEIPVDVTHHPPTTRPPIKTTLTPQDVDVPKNVGGGAYLNITCSND